jgi:two-component system, NarL family, sensor kinase
MSTHFLKIYRHLISLLLFIVVSTIPAIHTLANQIDSLKSIIAKEGNSHNKLKAILSLTQILATKDFEATKQYGQLGLQIAGRTNDSISAARLYNTIGEATYFAGKYDSAAFFFYKAVNLLENNNNKSELALAFNNLAKLYRKTKELDKADNNYRTAMNLYIQANDSAGIQMIWNEWGVVFEYRQLYDSAIKYYKNSGAIAALRNDSTGLGYVYSNIAGVYTLQKKYTAANEYIQKCIAIRQALKDSFALSMSYSDLGTLLASQRAYSDAIGSIFASNEMATKMGFLELLHHNYLQLADIYEATGNYQDASSYLRKASSLHDSIYSIEKNKQIAELNTKYETDKKEQQILLQQTAISKKNYLLAASFAILLLGSWLGHSYYRRYKIKQEARHQNEIMQQQYKATQAVLDAEEKERQRIGKDLHDGVGQIMSAVKINLLVLESDLPGIGEVEKMKFENLKSLVDESCKEVRSVSHTMMPNALLKSGLSSAIRDFINKIDSKALETNLYTEGLNERLATNVETVIYRVVQECVNNVIKHSHATRIDIAIIKDNEGISITIEDNGIGFDSTDPTIYEGIGLKNIITRVRYLNGTIDFDSRINNGTVVIIHIPTATDLISV